jgi:hypothetical protein
VKRVARTAGNGPARTSAGSARLATRFAAQAIGVKLPREEVVMHDPRWQRRQVLAGSLAGLGGLALGDGRSEAAAPAGGRGVTFDPAVERLVRLIEETPREELVDVAAKQIRAGAGYRELLGATFLAGVRRIRARPVGFEFHCVLAIHSAHLAAQGGPASERFLPLLWAMDTFKDAQATKRRKGESDWVLPALDGARLPPASQARTRYGEAMASWDVEAADVAVAALVRSTPAEQIRDLLFRNGARDFRDIGHKAIYAANGWRTLQTIGWQHAEPVLRSLTFACLEHEGSNPAQRDASADRPWRENLERVKKIRPGWSQGKADPAAVRELVAGLRRSSPADSSAAVAKLLGAGIAPVSIWDGLFLFASEQVMRHHEIVSLHGVTTTNALHQAFHLAGQPETRLLMLLQAAAFLTMFRDERDDTYQDGPRLDTLEPQASKQAPADTVREVFTDVGPETPRAARTALALLGRDPNQGAALVTEGRRLLFAKGRGSHDYKFSSAVFEDFTSVSPAHRARYLAANLALLSGASETDNPLVTRAHTALRV